MDLIQQILLILTAFKLKEKCQCFYILAGIKTEEKSCVTVGTEMYAEKYFFSHARRKIIFLYS